jgi:hypothetical protein
MKRIAIIAYFFLFLPTILFSSEVEPTSVSVPLSFPDLAIRAQKATEHFLQNPPDCLYGFYDLQEDRFMEINFNNISPEQPLHLPTHPGLLVAKRCMNCIQRASDLPASASMINEMILTRTGSTSPQVPSQAYWLTGYVSEKDVSCEKSIAVVPNFYYAQEILRFFQENRFTHPRIRLFATCGKFTEEEFVERYIKNYELLLGGATITAPSDIDYQIHDWTVHFLASLLMTTQKFEAMHAFLRELSIMIEEISEKYPTRESVRSTPIPQLQADELYKNGAMSASCLGALMDNLLSVFWSFDTQAMITCVHRRHPFLPVMLLHEEQIRTETFFPSQEYYAPNLSIFLDNKEAHLKFMVQYLFTLNNKPIFPNYPMSVEEICSRLRPSFSDAFTDAYLTLPTALSAEKMHRDFSAAGKDIQLTFAGYRPQSKEKRRGDARGWVQGDSGMSMHLDTHLDTHRAFFFYLLMMRAQLEFQ